MLYQKKELEFYTFPHLNDAGLVVHGFTLAPVVSAKDPARA